MSRRPASKSFKAPFIPISTGRPFNRYAAGAVIDRARANSR